MRAPTIPARLIVSLAVLGGAITGASRLLGAQAPDVKDDYARPFGFRARIDGTVYNVPGPPSWLEDGRFWYRRTVKGGAEFVVVDPKTAVKQPLFDHARLASALSAASHESYTATTLPFTTLTLTDSPAAIEFGSPRWRCTLTDYACTRVPDADGAEDAAERRRGRGRGGADADAAADPERTSPDGKTVALIEDFNVFIRKRFDFFVRHLQHREPPAWSQLEAPASNVAAGLLDARAEAWADAEDWE